MSRAPDSRVIWLLMSVSLPLTCVTMRVSPSGSLSAPLPRSTFSVSNTVSAAVVSLSSSAIGGSLTPSMVMVTVAVSVPPLPSLIV